MLCEEKTVEDGHYGHRFQLHIFQKEKGYTASSPLLEICFGAMPERGNGQPPSPARERQPTNRCGCMNLHSRVRGDQQQAPKL